MARALCSLVAALLPTGTSQAAIIYSTSRACYSNGVAQTCDETPADTGLAPFAALAVPTACAARSRA